MQVSGGRRCPRARAHTTSPKGPPAMPESASSVAEPFCEIPDLAFHLRGLLAQIPVGRVTTCGALAEALGNRIAARWVGHFTLHHPHHGACPCHRVVRAGGQIGPYVDGGPEAKARRLRAEGIVVTRGTLNLERYAFDGFATDRPLERLTRVQEAILRKVRLRPRRRIPKLIGGVDVSYPRTDVGVAAYALVATDTGELVWSTTVRRAIGFPYISTYLAFREMPLMLDLLEGVRSFGRLAEVLLVDGSGILHPRHAGVAAHLGVDASLATIGVTKKLLCGEVELAGMRPQESRPVRHADRLIGVAVRPTAGSRRPIFVSPGHRADVAFAERVVRQMLRGRRLPEPLYWADRFSRSPVC